MTSFIKIIRINRLIHLVKVLGQGFRPRFNKELLNIKTGRFCGRGI